jgi:hypothetical protein
MAMVRRRGFFMRRRSGWPDLRPFRQHWRRSATIQAIEDVDSNHGQQWRRVGGGGDDLEAHQQGGRRAVRVGGGEGTGRVTARAVSRGIQCGACCRRLRPTPSRRGHTVTLVGFLDRRHPRQSLEPPDAGACRA